MEEWDKLYPGWLKLALKIAYNIDDYRFRLGAVLVKGGSVIAKGRNRQSKHYNFEMFRGLHAEIAALRWVSPNVSRNSYLYVGRLRMDNTIGLALPCSNCMNMITRKRIKKIIYTTDTGGYKVLSL